VDELLEQSLVRIPLALLGFYLGQQLFLLFIHSTAQISTPPNAGARKKNKIC
jgi:hypothetical protein